MESDPTSGSEPGDEVLVALGRRPNSDRFDPAAAGIGTDDNGIIVTNDHPETSAENVWAQGDVADNAMFRHSGDSETGHVVAMRNGVGPGTGGHRPRPSHAEQGDAVGVPRRTSRGVTAGCYS